MKAYMMIFSIVCGVFIYGNVFAQRPHHGRMSMMTADSDSVGMMMPYHRMMGQHSMYNGMMGNRGMYGNMYQSMMGGFGMMMPGMMQGPFPMMRSMQVVNTLPEMKIQLNLTDAQMQKLADLQSGFLKKRADWVADIQKNRIDLNILFDKKASAPQVRKILDSMAGTMVDMQVAAYETSQQMLAVLTPEQQGLYDNMRNFGMGQQK